MKKNIALCVAIALFAGGCQTTSNEIKMEERESVALLEMRGCTEQWGSEINNQEGTEEKIVRVYNTADLAVVDGERRLDSSAGCDVWCLVRKPELIRVPGATATAKLKVNGERLVELIKRNVAPGTWDASPDCAMMATSNNNLVVSHAASVQEKVRDFLGNARSVTRTIVSVEARYYLVDAELFSDVEIDWRNLPRPDGELLDIGGLGTQYARLEKDMAQKVLRTLEQRRTSELLWSPRLTVLDGERANIMVSKSVPYIQDYVAEAGTISGANPKIGFARDVGLFDVRPLVDHDHRTVTMELKSVLIWLQKVREIESPLSPPPKIIQVPWIFYEKMDTNVQCPDQGSIIIGGIRDVLLGDSGERRRLVILISPVCINATKGGPSERR